MNRLVSVALMTAVWAALLATSDWRALGFGLVVSWGLLAFSDRLHRTQSSRAKEVLPRPVGSVILSLFFLRELVMSAVSVAREAWRPKLAIRPGIASVPLEFESDLETAVLASLISLTPGTLSLEVSPDRKTLYVHGLVVRGDGSEIRDSIDVRLKRPVQRAFTVRSVRASRRGTRA